MSVCQVAAWPAISVQVKQASLAKLDSNVKEILVLFVIEVTDDIGVQVALLEQLDFLFRQTEILGQHALDGNITILLLYVSVIQAVGWGY